MSFLATQLPPPPADEPAIRNDGWFPDVLPADLRQSCRLDGTVTPQRLRQAVLAAMLGVNRELQTYAAANRALGFNALADVLGAEIGGEPCQVILYRRAVYSACQAELVEAYRDFDTTGAGDKHAEKLEPKADEHRRNMRWAVSDLLGQRRTTVELI